MMLLNNLHSLDVLANSLLNRMAGKKKKKGIKLIVG